MYRDAGTARPLPRLLKGRTRGPVFVTRRRPGPNKVVGPRDVCPTPSSHDCRTARPAPCSTGTPPRTGPAPWDLHEFRHSGLTHLGQAGESLLMPMPKSRHRKAENLQRYFHLTPEAIAELTGLLAPGDHRR